MGDKKMCFCGCGRKVPWRNRSYNDIARLAVLRTNNLETVSKILKDFEDEFFERGDFEYLENQSPKRSLVLDLLIEGNRLNLVLREGFHSSSAWPNSKNGQATLKEIQTWYTSPPDETRYLWNHADELQDSLDQYTRTGVMPLDDT